jgi:hypothetical protein
MGHLTAARGFVSENATARHQDDCPDRDRLRKDLREAKRWFVELRQHVKMGIDAGKDSMTSFNHRNAPAKEWTGVASKERKTTSS